MVAPWTARELARIDKLLSHVQPQFQEKCRAFLLFDNVSFAQGFQDWWIFHNVRAGVATEAPHAPVCTR